MKQFLYPTSRQYPFDEVSGQIVRALEKRGWKVPGFLIEFHDYGSGAQKVRYVSSIKSDRDALDRGQHDVKILFGRPQDVLPGGRFNDCAAVYDVQLPGQCLRVFQDESGPNYEVYVGDSWERDRSTYWNGYNTRLNKEPRRCVRYSGKHSQSRSLDLVWHSDDREYGPEGDEPTSFRTRDVMESVRVYLSDVVLAAIEAYPVTGVVTEPEVPRIPFPAGVGPLFAYCEYHDVRRIEMGKKSLDKVQLADRYGLSGDGRRLAPMYIPRGPDLPTIAFDGFLWCGTSGRVPGEQETGIATNELVKVLPTDARGVYIADQSAYTKLWDGGGTHHDCVRARACTIVPLTEYKGSYEHPIYLINRELGLDEVELVQKVL